MKPVLKAPVTEGQAHTAGTHTAGTHTASTLSRFALNFKLRRYVRGTVQQQYKQIANAVSPQLTKALTRSILSSLMEAHTGGRFKVERDSAKVGRCEVVYSPSLQNFRDFMATFDECKVQGMKRHTPMKVRVCEGGVRVV